MLQEFALFFRGGIGELISIDEGCRAFSRFAKMLQMSKLVALRRRLFVIPFVFLQIDFRITFFGERAIVVMQMLLARNELMPAIQSACCEVNARGIKNLCHLFNI